MAHGGSRPGAGRKAGSPNKASAEREAAITASGLTPLEYMLQVMRDEAQPPPVRLDAAKSAAPYVHPKLSSAEVKHGGEIGVRVSKEQRDASFAAALRADT